MQFGTTTLVANAAAAMAIPQTHRWTAWGPAAGRVSVGLNGSIDFSHNMLGHLAWFDDADRSMLGRVADRVLERDADRMISSAPRIADGPFLHYRDVTRPPNPQPLASSPWADDTFRSRFDTAEHSYDLHQLMQPYYRFPDYTMHEDSPVGLSRLTTDLFATGGRVATLAMEAEESEPGAPSPPRPPVDRGNFKAAAGLLGAGFAGATAGAVASWLGAPTLLSFGLGGVAASTALWFLTDRFPLVDLTPVWDLFDNSIGKLTDRVLDWFSPGSGYVPETPGVPAPAASQLGFAVTAREPGIIDRLTDAAWSLFD